MPNSGRSLVLDGNEASGISAVIQSNPRLSALLDATKGMAVPTVLDALVPQLKNAAVNGAPSRQEALMALVFATV